MKRTRKVGYQLENAQKHVETIAQTPHGLVRHEKVKTYIISELKVGLQLLYKKVMPSEIGAIFVNQLTF